MRNFDVRIPVKLEVKVPIFGPTPHQPSTPQSPPPPTHTHTNYPHKHLDTRKRFWLRQKILTHVKKLTHTIKFDPRNPRKNNDPRKKYFDPRNPRNPRKNLTLATHTLANPRNPRTHVNHVTTQPTRFSMIIWKWSGRAYGWSQRF